MDNLILDLEDKMQKTIASLNNEFKKIRTGRANPSMLDDIKIDYYGSPTPVNQAASISVEEGRTLTISPWDKSLIEDIEKAIMKSDLGLNPNTSGDLIRLTMPVLTEETRSDYIKQAKNEAKIAIRNIRRDANNLAKNSEKNNEISQDEMKRLEAEVQRVTDTFIDSIENELKKKEADLSEI